MYDIERRKQSEERPIKTLFLSGLMICAWTLCSCVQNGSVRDVGQSANSAKKTASHAAVELPKELKQLQFPAGRNIHIELADVSVATSGVISVQVSCIGASNGIANSATVFYVTKRANLQAPARGPDAFSGPAGFVALWHATLDLPGGSSGGAGEAGGFVPFETTMSTDGRTVTASGTLNVPIDDLAPQAIGLVLVRGGLESGNTPVSNFIWVPLTRRP